MKIKVTQEHIANGVRSSNCGCPIALAIKEAVGHDNVRVSNTIVAIDDGHAYLPLSAIDFITRFDTGHRRSVAAFEFDL